ncbi:MAG: hypothetical protein JO053_06055 [Acidobacteria bacterium]|nr:hypothetical protein [Acidobacteriota bacterium]
MFIVKSKKQTRGLTIYTGAVLNNLYLSKLSVTECIVAQKDTFFAHGHTAKEAIQDVRFKEQVAHFQKNPINPTQLITIEHYRLITGACNEGIRQWRERNGVKQTRMRADKLLKMLESTDAYGLDRFKELMAA